MAAHWSARKPCHHELVLASFLGYVQVEVQPFSGGACDVKTTRSGAWGSIGLSAGWLHLPDVLGQPLLLTYCKAVDADD